MSSMKTVIAVLAVSSASFLAIVFGPELLTWLASLGPLGLVLSALTGIGLAIAFDFVNGFHDTANASATIIYSGVLRPWVAIGMSAVCNFLGALLVGTTVALFVTSVIPAQTISLPLLISVLLAGLIWNLFTWYRGLPVSSTHCLIGSLVGGGLAAAGPAGISWAAFYKALIALAVSPVIGFLLAFLIGLLANKLVPELDEEGENDAPTWKHKLLPWMQILSSASVSFSHGSNDGQKTMGIITLILASQFAAFGYTTTHVPFWVVLTAATAIGLGTATGGWRVMETVGRKISHKAMSPKHGSSAELTTALTVFSASWLGVPVSTTHVLTSGVVGATWAIHGKKYTNTSTLMSIGLAWLLTLPVTAALAAAIYFVAVSQF